MNNNYPLGAAEDSKAPWKEEPLSPIEIEVTASNTLSKSDTIECSDYVPGVEEINFDDCNLAQAWKNQKYSAKEALELAVSFAKRIYTTPEEQFKPQLKAIRHFAAKVFNACEGWNEDEFEVIMD